MRAGPTKTKKNVSSDSSWQKVAHANLFGQLSTTQAWNACTSKTYSQKSRNLPSLPLSVFSVKVLGNLGLLKNLVMLLLQQLPAHSATGGPRKAERFAPSALKIPNASVLAEEICANAQHLNLETSAVSSRGFLKSTLSLRIYLRRRHVCLPCYTHSNICWT